MIYTLCCRIFYGAKLPENCKKVKDVRKPSAVPIATLGTIAERFFLSFLRISNPGKSLYNIFVHGWIKMTIFLAFRLPQCFSHRCYCPFGHWMRTMFLRSQSGHRLVVHGDYLRSCSDDVDRRRPKGFTSFLQLSSFCFR